MNGCTNIITRYLGLSAFLFISLVSGASLAMASDESCADEELIKFDANKASATGMLDQNAFRKLWKKELGKTNWTFKYLDAGEQEYIDVGTALQIKFKKYAHTKESGKWFTISKIKFVDVDKDGKVEDINDINVEDLEYWKKSDGSTVARGKELDLWIRYKQKDEKGKDEELMAKLRIFSSELGKSFTFIDCHIDEINGGFDTSASGHSRGGGRG